MQFVALYCATLLAFYLTEGSLRRRILLVASYFFYTADAPVYLVFLLWVTVASHRGGKALLRHRSKSVLAVSVILCLAPLAVFKMAELFGVALSIIGPGDVDAAKVSAIPIGISFYTLQAVSSIVDAYRGVGGHSDDLETHALYLAFFPQLLAGPIERAARLVPQLREIPTPAREDLYIGVKIMLWGYFCKLVVADNIAGVVDRVLGDYNRVPAASLPASLYLYSFQLYFDFLGYTMIAIGLGRTFGISLTRNFDRPYLATSIRSFWRRWHITLSSWLRDYLYVPLGGRNKGYGRFVLAISVTFLVSGIWHGGGLNFMLWGGIHAVMFLVGDLTSGVRTSWYRRIDAVPWFERLHAVASVLITFSLVSFAWLFFRVGDIGQIGDIVIRMGAWITTGASTELAPVFFRPDTMTFLALLGFAFVLDSLGVIQVVSRSIPKSRYEVGRELAVMNVIALSLVLFGDLGSRAFIYFRF
jgi:alginate O-acetyltransferase complex protein AlgI